MEPFLVGLITYTVGYWLGKRAGVAQTMLRMQGIIYDLQQIEAMWKSKRKQWNEDEL